MEKKTTQMEIYTRVNLLMDFLKDMVLTNGLMVQFIKVILSKAIEMDTESGNLGTKNNLILAIICLIKSMGMEFMKMEINKCIREIMWRMKSLEKVNCT